MASLGPILAVTIAVPDLERGARAYTQLLGHTLLAAGSTAGARWRVLGPAGARQGLVKLVEAGAAPIPAAFRTTGWSALEILVADAGATHRRCLGVEGFEVLQPPADVGGTSALRALQARGPGGEGVYLTQVTRPPVRFDLPSLEEGEHRVFVVVAGTHDVEGVRGFLVERFGVAQVTDHSLPVKVLNQAYGLPPATLHRISSVQLAGSAVIEIDEYPASAPVRAPGSCGIRSVTLAGSLDDLHGATRLSARREPPYRGAPARGLSAGPGLELELVDAADMVE